jgi:manganese/zinc/iron transport system permease protein
MGVMVALAALFGALAGVSGAVLSSTTARLPAGPTVVLCASGIVLLSLFLAPNRGLVWSGVRDLRNRRRLQIETVLGDLLILAAQHAGEEHGHSIAVLEAMHGGRGGAGRTLRALEARGWTRRVGADGWVLTPAGRAEAERLTRERG